MTRPTGAASRAGTDRVIVGTGLAIVAAGAGLGLIRFVGTAALERNAEALLASLALASLVMAPGVLVLLATAGRPVLLLPAAVALVPMSLLSMAGVTLPLLIPSACLFVAYGRRSTSEPGDGLRAAGVTILTATLLVTAAMALLVHQDPRTFADETSVMTTSDIVTYGESALCLVIVVATVGIDWWVTSPPGRTGRRAIPKEERLGLR